MVQAQDYFKNNIRSAAPESTVGKVKRPVLATATEPIMIVRARLRICTPATLPEAMTCLESEKD